MYIFGCVAKKPCRELLFEKLAICDDGGYDSIGIAINIGDGFACDKGVKSLNEIKEIFPQVDGTSGLVHGRWATCGERSNENAHPFISGEICCVSNGTVENASEIRKYLMMLPYPDSDGAVLPNYISAKCENGMLSAVNELAENAKGNFSFVAMRKGENALFALNHGAPLYVLHGDDGGFISSEISAFSNKNGKIFVLENGETAQITADKITFYSRKMKRIKKQPTRIALKNTKNIFKPTLGETISAMPLAVDEIISKFTSSDKTQFPNVKIKLSGCKRVYFVGSGSSYNLALSGAANFEAVCDVPSFAYSSSEFCASNAVCDKSTLVVAVSSSGETADTLSALEIAQKYGSKTLALTANSQSRLARKCKNRITISTSVLPIVLPSAFYCLGYVALSLLAVHFGVKTKTITPIFGRMAVKMAGSLPDKIRLILKSENELSVISKKLVQKEKTVIIGQNVDFSTAKESASLLSELTGKICYALPSGEVRHTVLPMIDENTAVVAVISGKELLEKTCEVLNQCKIRGASTFVFCGESLLPMVNKQSGVFAFPDSIPLLNPVCQIVSIELISSFSSIETEYSAPQTLSYFAI